MNIARTVFHLALLVAPLSVVACAGASSSSTDDGNASSDALTASDTLTLQNGKWLVGDALSSSNLEVLPAQINFGADVNISDKSSTTYRIINGDSQPHDFHFEEIAPSAQDVDKRFTLDAGKSIVLKFKSYPSDSVFDLNPDDGPSLNFNVEPNRNGGSGGCESPSQGFGFTQSDCASQNQGMGFR